MTKKIAVLNITSRCNLACKFCFGPELVAEPFGVRGLRKLKLAATNELSTQQVKNKIFRLKKSGVKILIFSGGEPLLRQDIFELIDYAKKLGFFTVLHTNGILFSKKIWSKLKSNLDQINFPLEGYNSETNDALRGKGHFKKVMSALNLLKDSKVRVIISTVASAKNKDWVVKIGEVLPKWIYKWRIFQFYPQGKAKKAEREFALTREEFEKIKEEISKLVRHNYLPFKVQYVGMKDKFWKSYKIF